MPETNTPMQFAGLNRSQRKFCRIARTRNVRLLAPAGSGKTFSLLWRCKFITDECDKTGSSQPRFLILTFTRSARFELENRLQTNLEFAGIHATVRTLNSWGWEQVRKVGKSLIVREKDRKDLVSHDLLSLCRKYAGLAPVTSSKQKQNKYAGDIIDLMDLLKSLGFVHTMNKRDYKSHVKLITKLGLYPNLSDGYEKLWRLENISTEKPKVKEEAEWEFFQFWKKAVVQLYENNRFTLEDQKYWARIFFDDQINNKKFPQGGGRYTHIIVDEFQDINPLDLELLKSASLYHGRGKHVSLTIVGDDDQAIFGWRGTTPEFILHPEDYFGVKFETAVLDTNYRSPRKIVEISSKLISYNRDRVPKEMKSGAKGTAVVSVLSRNNTLSTIETTMNQVHKLIDTGKCESIALIGRKQTSLFPYQILLSAENVKYNVAADIDIFDGDAMQALEGIIQIVYRAKQKDNDNPVEDVLTIIDRIDRYKLQLKERGTLQQYLLDAGPVSIDEVLTALTNYNNSIKNKKPEDICETIEKLINAESVYDLMKAINQELDGLSKDYTKADTDVHYKEPQFFRLTEISKKYGNDFKRFYQDIQRAKNSSVSSRKRSNDDSGVGYAQNQEIKIHLVTATRSKGHEYDAAIILDADDDEWPNRLTGNIQEERRLFYVAMTRARKYLYFTVSRDKLESRFLLEAGLI